MKQIKKGIVYALTGSMLLSNITPALAYTYKDSVADVEYIDVTENATNNTTVYAEVGSFFKVTIPKHIILNGTTKSGAYTVGVEGDIAGTEVVNVVPDESFALKSNFLNDVTATINQDKTEWSYNEMLENNAVIGNGVIDAKDITAGSWNGNFNFNIKLENNLVNQKGLTLSVNDNVALGVEDSLQVDAYINGVKSNDVVTWNSNNENITVNNGLIETKASAQVGNTATITVTAQDQTELTAMQTALSDLGLVTYANATDDLSIDFVVTIVDIEYSVDELNLKAGESIDVTAKIIPEDINGTVSWSQTAISGINLVKNGNTVTVKVADNVEAGKSYNLIATYGDYSKTLTINIIENILHTHIYTENIITEATCEADGIKIFTCECGDNYTESIPAIEHNFVNNICESCGTNTPGLYDKNGQLLYQWNRIGYTDTIPSNMANLIKNYKVAKVVIPSSVNNIENDAFKGCVELIDIVVDPSNKSYSSINGVLFTKDRSSLIAYPNGKNNTSYTIPNEVNNINDYAFYQCANLTNITISENVTNIGQEAFNGCTGLTSITLENANIGAGAFINCTGLKTVTIGSGVTTIGRTAFGLCTNLTNIIIPANVVNIGENAFTCYNLKNVYFQHDTLPNIEELCFGKTSGVVTTFYFKNNTIASDFASGGYYYYNYGNISDNYNW